jgi:hypothetical protein
VNGLSDGGLLTGGKSKRWLLSASQVGTKGENERAPCLPHKVCSGEAAFGVVGVDEGQGSIIV